MGACRVGRMALWAASRAEAGAMASRLETALRLAAWPQGNPGEVLLLRRLDLGALPAEASAHRLTDLIGRRLSHVRPLRLRPGDAERPDAPAVAFAGRIEALAALAVQLARQGGARAWYWRRLVPLPPASPSLAAVAPRLLAEAARPPHRLAGVAALARLLVETGTIDAFVAALPAAVVARFLPPGSEPVTRLSTVTAEHAPPESAADAATAPMSPPARAAALWKALPVAWRAALARQARALAEADPRLEWLATMAVVASYGPACAGRLAVAPAELIRITRLSARRQAPPAPARARGAAPPAEPSAVPGAQDPSTSVEAPPDMAPMPEAQPASDWAGLWLLPAALARLHIGEIESGHGPGLGLACMRAVARRLGVPEEDPALAPLPEPAPPLPGSFVAPLSWRRLMAPHARATPELALSRAGGRRLLTDRAGRLPLAWTGDRGALRRRAHDLAVRRRPDSAPPPDLALRALFLALARDLRRAAGLSLRRLVHRRGTIAASATHVDVTFPGDVIELRLRKAGLDLDPGWLPWLGRVVAYHYDLEQRVLG